MRNSERTSVRVQADHARRMSFFLAGFLTCNGLMAAGSWLLTARRLAAPPPAMQQNAVSIARAVLGDAAPVSLTWCHINAPVAHERVWAAEVWQEEKEAGRLVFAPEGRLRQCSFQAVPGAPVQGTVQALMAVRHFLCRLDKKEWRRCPFAVLPPRRHFINPAGTWHFRGQQDGRRVHLAIDAQTGALLFFAEADNRPACRPLPSCRNGID